MRRSLKFPWSHHHSIELPQDDTQPSPQWIEVFTWSSDGAIGDDTLDVPFACLNQEADQRLLVVRMVSTITRSFSCANNGVISGNSEQESQQLFLH